MTQNAVAANEGAPNMACAPPTGEEASQVPPANRHFTPISTTDLLSGAYIDKVVYLGTSATSLVGPKPDWAIDEVSTEEILLAGAPLRLCYVEGASSTGNSGRERFSAQGARGAIVKTVDGKRRVVESWQLSSTPLAYQLGKTGKAEDLVKGLFLEGYRSSQAQIALFESNAYSVVNLALKDASGEWKINETKRQGEAFDKVIEAIFVHLRPLVGGGQDRQSVMSLRQDQWIVKAEDPKVLDWYVDGSNKGEGGAEREAMLACLQNRDDLVRHAGTIAEGLTELETKPWRERLQGASEQQLQKLDEEESQKVKRHIEEAKQKIELAKKNPDCDKALAYAGETPGVAGIPAVIAVPQPASPAAPTATAPAAPAPAAPATTAPAAPSPAAPAATAPAAPPPPAQPAATPPPIAAGPPPSQPPSQYGDQPPVDTPAASRGTSGKRVAGYVVLGVGAASLITSAILGAKAIEQHSIYEDRCGVGGCSSAYREYYDTYQRNQTFAFVTLGVGVVAVGAGLYLVLSGDGSDAPKRAQVRPWIGWQSLGAEGYF
jgi:hypothetical protein